MQHPAKNKRKQCDPTSIQRCLSSNSDVVKFSDWVQRYMSPYPERCCFLYEMARSLSSSLDLANHSFTINCVLCIQFHNECILQKQKKLIQYVYNNKLQQSQIILISEHFSHHNNAGDHSLSSNYHQIQTELLSSSLAEPTSKYSR